MVDGDLLSVTSTAVVYRLCLGAVFLLVGLAVGETYLIFNQRHGRHQNIKCQKSKVALGAVKKIALVSSRLTIAFSPLFKK